MLKNICNKVIMQKLPYNSIYLKTLSIFSFSRKNTKIKTAVEIAEEESAAPTNIIQATYPYLPLNDHPLIPGYGRLITVTSEVTNKLKELNAEKTKIVVSVIKSPENTEALQSPL
jgi:hypothetical protein